MILLPKNVAITSFCRNFAKQNDETAIFCNLQLTTSEDSKAYHQLDRMDFSQSVRSGYAGCSNPYGAARTGQQGVEACWREVRHYCQGGTYRPGVDRKSTRLNSSHIATSRMPSSA